MFGESRANSTACCAGFVIVAYPSTFDEVGHLDLDRPLLQILDHHVGYPGQVTHVSPPSSALGSVIDR